MGRWKGSSTMRESGILMPVFSLPSKFGIGCLDDEAYKFVDFLSNAEQGFWQVLPLGPTGFGNSPYQPLSAFAGNPYFISPEKLINDGLLTWDDCNCLDFGSDIERVDYGAIYSNRAGLLRLAYNRFLDRCKDNSELNKEYKTFIKDNDNWIVDFALYHTIKKQQDNKAWFEWEDKYRLRDKKALDEVLSDNAEYIDFIYFRQFMFMKQWEALHEYAKSKNVKIIGDLPFYVSLDSADVWQHPEVFLLDKDLVPKVVAGCPPDAFSTTGQMWGNPIYDWATLKTSGYKWWIDRIKRNQELFDVIRIDHFHGFAEYYAIPYGAENAVNGKQEKGPGLDFFKALEKALGRVDLIAEDLGTVTKDNEALLTETGIPGMKVLQYAFTSWDSKYLTHRHEVNSVVYTGTHDNIPSRAWIEDIEDGHRDFTRRYLNSKNTDFGGLVWDFIREAYRSCAKLCIIPLQDYLVKGREARINCPGTMDGNWEWRLVPNFLSNELAMSIREMVETYGRVPVREENSK